MVSMGRQESLRKSDACEKNEMCWLGHIKAAMNEGSEVELGCFSGCKLRPGSKPSSSSQLLNSCLLCWAAGV